MKEKLVVFLLTGIPRLLKISNVPPKLCDAKSNLDSAGGILRAEHFFLGQ